MNGNLKNATVAAPSKNICNFWRWLEMPLINCKVEIKIKWTKCCVLSAAGADNDNVNCNNITFTVKDRILCPCCKFISKK